MGKHLHRFVTPSFEACGAVKTSSNSGRSFFMRSQMVKHEEVQSPERGLVDLKQLVKRYRICWEVLPEYVYEDHERRQTGFRLELVGTHEPGVDHPEPGCVK